MPATSGGSQIGTATILFTDVVGSTAQRAQLGEEAADRLRQIHDRLLAGAIARHHGTVVKSTGDGVMATFAGAADGLAAAVGIQQAVERHNRSDTSTPLVVRIGISLGDVTWEQQDCFGTSVVEAARLCAAAEGGQILVADVVRMTARGRGHHRFTPIGNVALKGLPEPVATSTLEWEPLVHGSVPLPPRCAAEPLSVLVGRETEERVIADAWRKAKEGQRQVVLVAGEPGIGKTRLVADTVRAIHAEGGTVLLGACDEDVGVPYRPFVEAIRHYVAHAPDDVLVTHAHAHHGELGRLVPELAERVPGLPKPQVAEAETERYLLFEAAVGLLGAASQHQPLVLVLEDLHWAAPPELLLLKHLVRFAGPLRVLVIATYRDNELTRTHPLAALLADLRREVEITRLTLRGLDEAAVVDLMTATTGRRLSEDGVTLARAIHRQTEGSPLFVGEILRNLIEAGGIVDENGRWHFPDDVTQLAIPEGIREVIGRRLARLAPTTNRVLQLAAVIGRQFDVPLLVRIAELAEDEVLDAVEAATAAALVTEVLGSPDHFSFSHILIRTTLYEELSRARRARLHRKIGEALEDLTRATPDARIDELAHHWLQAAPSDDVRKAVGYSRRAGDRALTDLAFEEATRHYEQALEVLAASHHDDQTRCDLLTALADAQRRTGSADYRDTVALAIAAARHLGDADRFGRAVLGLSQSGGFMTTAVKIDADIIALYEEASAMLGGSSTLRARVLGQLAVELIYTPERERRHAVAREAVDIARRGHDPTGLGLVLVATLSALNEPFTLGERRALAAELEALAEGIDSLELRFHAAFQQSGALLETADRAGVEAAITRMETLAERLRQPYYAWVARWVRAMWSITQGAPGAESETFAAYEFGATHGLPDAGAVFGAQLLNLRHDQGRLAEIVSGVEQSVDTLPHMPAWRAALATTYCETDRLDDARVPFAALAATDFELPLDWSWYCAMVHLAQTCDYLRDQGAAAVLYGRLEPIAEQVGTCALAVLCYGSLGYPVGLLASGLRKWDAAEHHFRQALATNDRLGVRPYAVRTRRAYASMLLDRHAAGDMARARTLIAAGLDEADALGMARERERLQRLAAQVP